MMHLQKNLVQVCDQDLLADDHFLEKDGIKFAGLHLLVEFWGAKRLKDIRLIKAALGSAAKMADATVLGVHAHTFSSGGVSGIAVLAESHISIHTWPERDFAAIDIFMCGECKPYAALSHLKIALKPKEVIVAEHKRGLLTQRN